MLTYVINTSENKTFDNNLLFELVGYSQIRWKHCSLQGIDLCAEEICDEERSKILSTGEYRIIVLVDFFGFPKTDPSETETASEYVEIYKAFIEHYLLMHLFNPLKQQNIPAKACEIYYIQYVPYEPLSINNMAMVQTADLLGLTDVAEELRRNMKNGDEESYEATEQKRDAFRLRCAGDVVLPICFGKDFRNPKPTSFRELYNAFINHRDDARKFGVVTHKPYVTFGDASRAAYDALSRSLYLVYLYERRDNVTPDTESPRVDDKAFVQLLRSSLRKIHSARSVALKNESHYYSLDFESSIDFKSGKTESKKEEKKVRERKMTEKDRFDEICRLADRSESAQSEEQQKQLHDMMKQYLARRDEVRARIQDIYEKDRMEIDESAADSPHTVKQCPSDIDRKRKIKEKEAEISQLLGSALEADFRMQDYSAEKEKAVVIYKKLKQAKACQTKNIFGDILMLLMVIVSMGVPYLLLQLTSLASKPAAAILLGISSGIFGGLFVFLFLTRLAASVSEIRRYRLQLSLLYNQCMKKKNAAMDALHKRYDHDLLHIELLRQNIREIERRDRLNREKNRHVEIHREKLEEVENLLSSMLNSFGERVDLTQLEDVRDEFRIDKPITAAENKIYKIFSMDAIDRLFKQKGGEMRHV